MSAQKPLTVLVFGGIADTPPWVWSVMTTGRSRITLAKGSAPTRVQATRDAEAARDAILGVRP